MPTITDTDLLAGLNPAQRDAVLHFEGPLLVLAGAGSGKTRVLTTRVARLIAHHGVDPGHLLAVTFTNKAAGEMRERIERLLGEAPEGMWAGTFHAIGARLLRRYASRVGRTAGFSIYDEADSLGVIKRLMERHRLSTRDWTPRAIRAAISDAKNALVTPAKYASAARSDLTRTASIVYGDLEPTMREANAVDFDDLLVLPVRLFREHPDVLAAHQERFQFILVDEYQDTNHAQYEFIRLLGLGHANVCVVGDDDQSIYGWRGADIRNILDFEKDFPNARVVRLEENYRSTPAILDVANAVIRANAGRRGKTLRATLEGGERVAVVAAFDERDEGEFVTEEIRARRSTEPDLDLRDFAILYRTNAQSRALEEAMRRHGIPYRLVGAVRFYDRREIRDLVAYLKLIANPADGEAFRRAIAVPKRGLGEATIATLDQVAREAGVSMLVAAARPDLLEGLRPSARQTLGGFAALIARLRERAVDTGVDELLRELIDAIGYGDHLRAEGPESQERLDNVRELVASAAETLAEEGGEVGLTPLDHFLQRASLIADLDALDPHADGVVMMTLHNAKGLEFPVVFITGIEQGLFPLARVHEDATRKALEEERRLFYVGITRAERKLYLVHANSRRRNGQPMPSMPSEFLRDIPEALVETRATLRHRATGRSVLPSQSAALRRPGTPVARPAFHDEAEVSQDAPQYIKGERVRHRRFGTGTIAELSGVGRDTKVTVDFDDESVGRKTLVIAYANLERGWD